MMTMARRRWRWAGTAGWAVALLLGAIPARPADLVATSPFLPTGAAALAAGAGGPAGPIELRGMMEGPEGSAYCIYDTAKKRDVWVGLNETGHDFVVKSADPRKDTVTVTYQGRIMQLSLHTAKVTSAGAGGVGPMANPAANAAAVVTPSPADEQRRLDAVAQEVRRRRAERERAAGETPGGAAAPIPGGPPPPGR